MKKAVSFFSLFFPLIFAYAGVITLEGNYQGQNIYVQNPFAGSGKGFCVTKVEVNGIVTGDDIESAAFEINLKVFNFKIGDKVLIEIYHQDDCKPKVLNPEVHNPKCTADFTEVTLSSDGKLQWKTINEVGKLPFIIEQFRWNKWVKIGEVDGIGGYGAHNYSFTIDVLHSGENQVRIKQFDYSSQPCYSKPVRSLVNIPEVTLPELVLRDQLKFSSATLYEIYDKDGNFLKKGFGETVDIKGLPADVYYLNYDNKTTEIIIKK